MKLDAVIREFVESYESRDPDYTPTDHERALIEDAINGFLHDFLKRRYSVPSVLRQPDMDEIDEARRRGAEIGDLIVGGQKTE